MQKKLLYQNKKIYYHTYGSGKPVILIHGFGEDSEIWNNQAEFLKDRFQLIIPDLPGSGKSEIIDDMSMEGMAEVIKCILDEEIQHNNLVLQEEKTELPDSKVPPCGGFRGAGACIIGHSMGGYITLAFAEKYQNHLTALGLFHSSAFADSEEKKATRRKGIDFINQHGAFEFLKTSTPNLFSPQTKDERPELIDEQLAAVHNFLPAALVYYYEAMINRPDRTELLRKATVPVLFIMGKYDAAVPLEDGLKQCHLPEKSYIHILQKSGHMGMLEEADESNRALNNFLMEL
ncbi:MAG: alpha/beta hydrolase [Bacteroidota bacterium]